MNQSAPAPSDPAPSDPAPSSPVANFPVTNSPVVEPVAIGPYRCGDGNLLVIAGPCVLQSLELTLQIAETLRDIAQRRGIGIIFKASFDKANRTSLTAERGPGMEAGLQMLRRVRELTGLPVTTDVHLPQQVEAVAAVCDLLQIPAFLARQTDLLVAAGQSGKPVNVKKGQFMAPQDMRYALEKIRQSCPAPPDGSPAPAKVLLCERGTFFGYGRLVNDMTSLSIMRALGAPVVFDATHSVQQPGGLGGATGGNREMVEPLARAAVAMGSDAVFFETHPDPSQSPSDGPNMIPLDRFDSLLGRLLDLHHCVRSLAADTSADPNEQSSSG